MAEVAVVEPDWFPFCSRGIDLGIVGDDVNVCGLLVSTCRFDDRIDIKILTSSSPRN